ncbi:MAG: hypothetical protein IJQ90_03065 [Alphaproteobacteria bacterium]|nr:hypothetical protein [Alphaproteobacteria bacterium]
MRISILSIGVIASVLTINAFAETTTSTITTQSYVDTNFQSKIPAGTVNSGSVVAYTSDAGTVGERGLYNANYARYAAQTANSNYAYYKDYLPTMDMLTKALTYLSNGIEYTPLADATSSYHWIPVFSSNNQVAFDHLLTVNSADAMNSSRDASQYIPTMAAMTEKQDKMTCTRYLDNAEETDENCLLWSIN